MSRALRALLASAALLLAVVALPARAAHAATLGPDDLTLVSDVTLGPRLHELTFRTAALSADTKVRVLLPDGYATSGSARFPMLFLLHGALGSYLDWSTPATMGKAEEITAGAPVIVVMPDGGSDGNYVDWYNTGSGGPPMWETYHIDQLIPWVDAHYRTLGTRSGRAVAGLSMGGNGAAHYAALFPDRFVAMASFSGALDTNDLILQPITGGSGASNGAPGAIYGPRATQEVRWRGNNPVDLAENLGGVDADFQTGNGEADTANPSFGCTGNDFTERLVDSANLTMRRKLLALGIEHAYDAYGGGCHTWPYWNRDLTRWFPKLMEIFAEQRNAPERFTYTTIRPQFSVYGWDVTMARPVLEFATIRRASAAGFLFQGSGTANVVTGARYAPGSKVLVRIATETTTTTVEQVVPADGRLRITVPLGPANAHQQYTQEAAADRVVGAINADLGHFDAEAQGTKVYSSDVRITQVTSDEPVPGTQVPELPFAGLAVGAAALVGLGVVVRRRRKAEAPVA